MINKFHHFFISSVLLLVLTVIQPVFAGFKVTIVNRSDIVYKNVNILTIPTEGFDALYGRITIDTSKIAPGKQQTFTYGYKFCEIPLTGICKPAENSNLNVSVIANPADNLMLPQTREYKNVLKTIHIIHEDEPRALPNRALQIGIKPPNMEITLINEVDGVNNIIAKFSEENNE